MATTKINKKNTSEQCIILFPKLASFYWGRASLLQFLLSSLQCYCGLEKNARAKINDFLFYFVALEQVRKLLISC